jgi:hypothetical protein
MKINSIVDTAGPAAYIDGPFRHTQVPRVAE